MLWIAVVVPESELLAGATELRTGILALTFAMLLIGVFAAFRLASRFSGPIEALVRESDRISQGELDKTEPIESSVMEVMRLAEAHDRMRESLQVLFKLEQDLRLARRIQQSTFPDRLPVVRDYDLTAWSDPADETGGDTYDVVGLHKEDDRIRLSQEDGARVLLLLADAAGHGIGPALSVTQVRAMLRMAVRRETKLRRIVRDMNEQLCADLEGGRFITAWLGKLDPGTHTLRSLSAGQGPLLHYRAREDIFDVLNPAVPPLGVLAGVDIPEATSIPLERGDVFAVISDGIFEASDGAGGLYGVERVQGVVRANRKRSADDILHALRDGVARFTKGARATDDRTAVIVKRR
jgi:phosphoserine phosphatase